MCEEEARFVEMRPVAKAAPASSGPVGGSVSYVLGLDAVVLGDGGVTADYVDVGRYDSVGGVSCGGDMELCGVDTVLSGTVNGGLCDLDRVSGGCDTDESGVDTVLSDAVSGGLCDLDRVSGGGDTDVSRVDAAVVILTVVICDIRRKTSNANQCILIIQIQASDLTSICQFNNYGHCDSMHSTDGVTICTHDISPF